MLRRSLFRGVPLARKTFILRSNDTQMRPKEPVIHRKDAKTQEISEEFSGVPQEVLDQVVIIGKPPPNSMQSLDYFNYWEVRFPEGRQWHESLMGWTKSASTSRWARQLMKFDSRDAAVSFCEHNALSYQVENEKPVIYNKKNYGDKFKFRSSKKEDVDII